MAEFSVQPDTLGLIRQLAQRQGEHLDAMIRHLNAHTTMSEGGGLVMGVLGPMYHSGRDNAVDGLGQGKEICEAVAETAEESKQAYLDADEECRAALERATEDHDIDVPAASPPRPDVPLTLGPSQQAGVPHSPGAMDHVISGARNLGGAADSAVARFEQIGTAGTDVDGRFDGSINEVLEGVMPGRQQMHPFAQRVHELGGGQYLEDRAAGQDAAMWAELDQLHSNPGSSSTYQQRQELDHYWEFTEGSARGWEATGGADHPPANSWVDDDMTIRSWQTGQDVAGLYRHTTGAIADASDAVDAWGSRQTVHEVAGGTDNTASHDWAQDR